MIEISLKKQKWLLVSIYRPPSQSEEYFFDEIGKGLDFYSSKYESFCLIGDFNCEPNDTIISDFMDNYGLKNLVRSPTCFRSDSPRCIDLILTNRKRSFQNTVTVHTGLSDFHAMIVTALKGGYKKKGPKIIRYRNYAKFCAEVNRYLYRPALLLPCKVFDHAEQRRISTDHTNKCVITLLANIFLCFLFFLFFLFFLTTF